MAIASPSRIILPALGMLVASWGLLGLADIGRQTSAGYTTDGNNTVIEVGPGSPAESAGLSAGDFIESINGISTENAAELAGLARALPGETRSYRLRRDGLAERVEITFTRLNSRDRNLSRASILVGFCFLGFGLAATLGRQGRATRVLAFMGAGIGLAFLAGPHFESAGLRSVIYTLRNAIVLTGIAATLHFLLVFPAPRPFIERAGGRRLLYAPVMLFWLLISYRMLFTPAATSALNTLTNIFAGLIVGGYFVLSIITLLRSYVRASASERTAQGLRVMLWGTVLGLAPAALTNIVGALSPQTVWPGSDFYFLSLILIPVTWCMAARSS